MTLQNIEIRKADNGYTLEASYKKANGKDFDYERKSFIAGNNEELNTKLRELLDDTEEKESPKSRINQNRAETLKKIYGKEDEE